jgi:hypothetical protein
MPIGEFCIRQVVVATRETSVLEAAKLMRQHDVAISWSRTNLTASASPSAWSRTGTSF